MDIHAWTFETYSTSEDDIEADESNVPHPLTPATGIDALPNSFIGKLQSLNPNFVSYLSKLKIEQIKDLEQKGDKIGEDHIGGGPYIYKVLTVQREKTILDKIHNFSEKIHFSPKIHLRNRCLIST